MLNQGPDEMLYSALYANKLHTGYWQDINNIEKFGFLSLSSIGLQGNETIN